MNETNRVVNIGKSATYLGYKMKRKQIQDNADPVKGEASVMAGCCLRISR